MQDNQDQELTRGAAAEHAAADAGVGAYTDRKTYYISVQAGSVLEDPEVASYELEITANEEELNRLQELFEDMSSEDEAEAFHFLEHPFGSAPVERMNAGVEAYMLDIYKLLYSLGTPETKRHIESMGLFPKESLT